MLDALTPQEISAITLSLRVAGVAAAASLPFGILIAWLLARGRFFGRTLLDAIVHLPLVMPPVVTGYLLLLAFGRKGPVGALLEQQFGIVLAFRWTGAVLAAAVMGFPLMVRAIRLSIEAVDPGLERAATTLGAWRIGAFLSITLPLALPGILAGLVLAFARALGEFGATITFVGNIPNVTQTVPSAIYTYTQIPDGEIPALRLTIISVVIAFAALLVSEWFARRARRRTIAP